MSQASDATVDAVVVAYNSATTIEACLRALLAQTEVVAIEVVDNGSSDDTVVRVRAMASGDPRVRLLELPGNPGFAAGCNAGARVGAARWLLFVNPDLELPPGAVGRLLLHAGALSPPALLGADLRAVDGRRDPAARRNDLSLLRLLLGAARRGALYVAVDDARALQPVNACSGALMLLPRGVFAAVGGLDEGYRLHVEDLDFCRRLREAGFGVAVANDVPVLHHRGVSSRSRPFFVEWHKHRGLWRYWRRFEGRGPAILLAPLVASALALRLLLLAWPLAVLRRLSGRG